MKKNQQKTLLTTLLLSVIVVLATTQTFAQNRISKAKRVSQNVVLSRSTMNRTAASSAERAPIAANHARFNQNAIQPSGNNGNLSPMAMWNIQFVRNVDSLAGSSGTAGVVWTGTEFWVSKWNTPDTILTFSGLGAYTGSFSVAGLPTGAGNGIRAFTTDGTTIYAANNSTTIYKINPTTKTLAGSFTVPATVGATRWISYDPSGTGGFWCGNFNTSIFKISNPATGTATVLNTIPAATHTLSGMYGAAYDGTSPGGPYLWVFVQTNPIGGTSQAVIAQVQLSTGVFTYVSRDVNADLGSTTGLAGGLTIAQLPTFSTRSLIALDQGVKAISYELNFVQTFIPDVTADSIDPANGLTIWPLSQNGPVNFGGKVRNVGTSTASAVTTQVNVSDGVTNVATFNAPSVASLTPGAKTTYSVGPFTAAGLGTYIAEAISDASNDNLPSNDTNRAVFVVSDSTFARDYAGFGVNVSGLGVGAAATDNKKLGQVFTLNTPSTLTSITFYLSSAFAGQTVSASIFPVTNNVPGLTEIASTSIYTITQADQDSGVVLTLKPTTGNLVLPAGSFLVAVNELGDSTAGLATTPYIYTANKMFVKWDANAGGAWTDVGSFGANFKRAFVIRPNFGLQCPQLTSSGSVLKNVSCFGGNDGMAQVIASGSSTAFTYTWSPSGGNQATASGLTAGTYSVTIVDGNGCVAPPVSITITQPTVIQLSSSNIVGSPAGQMLGSATVNATGGTPNYTYSWAPMGGNQATATGLAPGNYTVSVTDSKGCVKTLSVTIPTVVAIDPSQIGITHWTISPNPSNGWFTIDMRLAHGDDIYLTITDMNGRVVFSENQINIKEIHESVRLNVASGAYTVQVYTSKGTASKRIIVQ